LDRRADSHFLNLFYNSTLNVIAAPGQLNVRCFAVMNINLCGIDTGGVL